MTINQNMTQLAQKHNKIDSGVLRLAIDKIKAERDSLALQKGETMKILEEKVQVIFIVRNFYGNGNMEDDEEAYQDTILDTPENRASLVEEYLWGEEVRLEREAFISGKTNYIAVESTFPGEWDEPTGRSLTLRTKEESLNLAKRRYEAEILRINYFFDKIN